MSGEAPRGRMLTEAFDRFRSAAATLQDEHAALASRIGSLEQALMRSDRRLGTVLDVLDVGIAVVAGDGRLLRTNRPFEACGFGRRGETLTHPALREMGFAPSRDPATLRFSSGGPGAEREWAASSVPVRDGSNARVLTLQDVTRIRDEEREGGRRRRLEALGRMAAEVAHEVRNPLGSIRLFAGMLRDDLAGDEGGREMVDQILAAVAGLEATVANLLSFASPVAGQRTPVDLARAAGEVCALLAPACAQRGVTLAAPPAEANGDMHVTSDSESPRQVLLNLVGNALAATTAGGRVGLGLQAQPDRVILTVEDDGCGIAPDDLPRVFDPFFSRTEGGTGLGLSIVHRIVEAHQGRISLDSRAGRGTRVRVEWPRNGIQEETADA